MSPSDTADLVLAVSEAFNNAVRHGTSEPQDVIELSLRINAREAEVELRYRGEPFAVGVPELPPPTSASGRGRYIMSMLLDQVDYVFEPPWTAVRMLKLYNRANTPRVTDGAP
jgi:anti-sigma regulatory factor (Ser/Thr protein kinase)